MGMHIFKIFLGVIILANSAHASDFACRYFYRGVQNDGGLFFENNTCEYGNGGYSRTIWNTLKITRSAQETVYLCTNISGQTTYSGGAGTIRVRFGRDGWGVLEEYSNGSWQKNSDIRCGIEKY